MSVEQISATLQTAMTEVLESMCFILPGEPVDMAAFAGEPWMEHTLTFHGPEEGRFGIRAPRPVNFSSLRRAARCSIGCLPLGPAGYSG